MSNEIIGVVILACVVGDLHIVVDVEFFVVGVDSLVVDVDEDFLMKHYIQFIPESEHFDRVVEILVMQMWMMCRLVFLSMLEWKPLVKMKLVVDLSLGIKVWDTLFYLPGESDVGASWVFLVTTLELDIVLDLGMVYGSRHGLGA